MEAPPNPDELRTCIHCGTDIRWDPVRRGWTDTVLDYASPGQKRKKAEYPRWEMLCMKRDDDEEHDADTSLWQLVF